MLRGQKNKYTVVGTDIENVKKLNKQSGLSYNEVKNLLALKYWSTKQK